MPVIGIPLKYSIKDDVGILTMSEFLRRSIQASGGDILPIIPVQDVDYSKTAFDKYPILTESDKEKIERQLNMIDGLILPGGTKETPYDMYILKRCIERDIPVLGICLGLQLMSSYPEGFNVEKIEDSIINHSQEDYETLTHKIIIKKDTLLYSILNNEEIMVNSYHKYKANNNSNFIINALSEDGNIEGLEMPNKKFILGVQWHPEISYSFDDNSKKIIDSFISACK